MCCCSEYDQQSSVHRCATLAGTARLNVVNNDVAGTLVCETEISTSLCPLGWAYYRDVLGLEAGRDSCVRISDRPVETGFAEALIGCPPGSHMLTVGSDTRETGLLRFAMSITPVSIYIGCRQTDGTAMARGWSWVDGTPAYNLNCGDGNEHACGVWGGEEPK